MKINYLSLLWTTFVVSWLASSPQVQKIGMCLILNWVKKKMVSLAIYFNFVLHEWVCLDQSFPVDFSNIFWSSSWPIIPCRLFLSLLIMFLTNHSLLTFLISSDHVLDQSFPVDFSHPFWSCSWPIIPCWPF